MLRDGREGDIVSVDGEPPIELPTDAGTTRWAAPAKLRCTATAIRIVNAMPYVVDAPVGVSAPSISHCWIPEGASR